MNNDNFWKLTAMTEALGELELVVEDTLSIGRGSDNDIVLGSKEVSRNHAQLSVLNNQLYVKDLSSSNGTFVNDAQITAEQSKHLNPNDQVSFASFRFAVVAPQASQEIAAPSDAAVIADTQVDDTQAVDAEKTDTELANTETVTTQQEVIDSVLNTTPAQPVSDIEEESVVAQKDVIEEENVVRESIAEESIAEEKLAETSIEKKAAEPTALGQLSVEDSPAVNSEETIAADADLTITPVVADQVVVEDTALEDTSSEHPVNAPDVPPEPIITESVTAETTQAPEVQRTEANAPTSQVVEQAPPATTSQPIQPEVSAPDVTVAPTQPVANTQSTAPNTTDKAEPQGSFNWILWG